jgi:RNA polymerase sigma factor (sigma-70 family)
MGSGKRQEEAGIPPSGRPKLRLCEEPLTGEQRRLVDEGVPLVKRCAAEIARRYHGLTTAEDLLAPGTFALREAARRFDPRTSRSFLVYARHHVRGRMIDAIRDERFSFQARVERAMDRSFEVLEAHHELEVDYFRQDDDQILAVAQQGADEVVAVAVATALCAAEGGDPEEALVDHLALQKAIASLPRVEREVVEKVVREGLYLEEAAEALQIHPNTAARRYARAVVKLRAFFVDRGS